MTPAHEAPCPRAPLCALVVGLAVEEPLDDPLAVAAALPVAVAAVEGGAVVLTAKIWVNDAVVEQEEVAGAA